MKIEIKPAVYSRKSTPPQDREYIIVGCEPCVGNIQDIREFVFNKFGKSAVIVGKTLEGKEIKEVFK
jgi:hypothetical protein